MFLIRKDSQTISGKGPINSVHRDKSALENSALVGA